MGCLVKLLGVRQHTWVRRLQISVQGKESFETMKAIGSILLLGGVLAAQAPNPTQQGRALMPGDTGQPMPIFRVTVVSRTIKAINYHQRKDWTRIDFRGTELMPSARGDARVES